MPRINKPQKHFSALTKFLFPLQKCHNQIGYFQPLVNDVGLLKFRKNKLINCSFLIVINWPLFLFSLVKSSKTNILTPPQLNDCVRYCLRRVFCLPIKTLSVYQMSIPVYLLHSVVTAQLYSQCKRVQLQGAQMQLKRFVM